MSSSFDGRTFGIYTGISVAVFGLIGVAAGTIGFTAFLLAVPLLFVGFDFLPQEAIFISAAVDCTNALLILGLSYLKREDAVSPLLPKFSLHFRALLFVGSIAIVCCCTCLVFSARILELSKTRLKGGIGYVLLVIGALFILKGVLAYRKQRLLAMAVPVVVEVSEEAPLLAVNSVSESSSGAVLSVSDVLCCRTPPHLQSTRWRKAWAVIRPIIVFVVCLISGCLAGLVVFLCFRYSNLNRICRCWRWFEFCVGLFDLL